MDDLLLPNSLGSASSNLDALPISLRLTQPDPIAHPDFGAVFDILRQALASGARSTDSILRAAADAARALTGADGAAVALKNGALIVCRARSGGIAPELGAPLNSDSGISGECLRTATILVCNDAATDTRVDPDVCMTLGVRSIIAVPLRGAKGIAGILEAFSTCPNAFSTEQIDSLRALAEIAEMAYEREFRLSSPVNIAAKPAARIAGLLVPSSVKKTQAAFSDEYRPRRRYWIAGIVAIALILVSLVVWFTWREPVAEIAMSETPAQPLKATVESSGQPAAQAIALKPEAGVVSRPPQRTRSSGMLQNAANIEVVRNDLHPADLPSGQSSTAQMSRESVASRLPVDEPPPSAAAEPPTAPAKLASLASANVPLPAFGAPVSTGVTEAILLHKVDPVYPQEARLQRISGSVVLDGVIAEDGSVREVKVVSGPQVLAAAAIEAVGQWRYRPSMLNGKSVEIEERITIVFTLPETKDGRDN